VTGSRRFQACDPFPVDGIWYRIRTGSKGTGDLRLDWYVPSGPDQKAAWRPVSLEHAALHVDFIHDNENVIHPPPEAGGAYVLKFLRQVFSEGWRQANHDLHLQRNRKHSPELYGDDTGSDAA
jgi:hypothetical protein